MTRVAITSPYGYALADVYSKLVIHLEAVIDHIYRDNIEHIRCQGRYVRYSVGHATIQNFRVCVEVKNEVTMQIILFSGMVRHYGGC